MSRADTAGMAWWLLVAWAGLGALVALVWRRCHRGRRVPADVGRFLLRLRAEIARAQPGVEWRGWLPGRFTAIVAVDGQETPLPLQALYEHARAFPDAFGSLVARTIAEIRAEGLETPDDHDFQAVAADVLPQIKGREWLRTHAPAFGDAALVHRDIGGDLVVCYVIDAEWTMVYVCHGHLRAWNRSEEDVFHLATRNLLRKTGGPPRVPARGDEPVLVRTGDGYDAARVVLLDPERVEGLLVAVPDRDVLWLGAEPSDGSELARLMSLNAEQSRTSRHPVSAQVFRVHDGRLEALAGER